jgi:hypothetical protein
MIIHYPPPSVLIQPIHPRLGRFSPSASTSRTVISPDSPRPRCGCAAIGHHAVYSASRCSIPIVHQPPGSPMAPLERHGTGKEVIAVSEVFSGERVFVRDPSDKGGTHGQREARFARKVRQRC